MIYLAIDILVLNSAPGNHFMAIAKRFKERCIPFKLVTFSPNVNDVEKEARLMGVDYIDVAGNYPLSGTFAKKVWRNIYAKWLFRRNIVHFANTLSNNDSVFIYAGYHCLDKFLASGSRLFLEYTEHPQMHDFKFRNDKERNAFYTNIVRVDGVFVISTAIKAHYQSLGVSADRVTIVNMIADSNRFAGLWKETVGNPYIAYCGSATNNKDGVDRLLKAFAMIAGDFSDLKLYIIGRKPTPSEPGNNCQLATDLGIVEKVVFTGLVSRDSIPQLLKNASVLALARPDSLQAKNGFPTKLGEYLLTRNPVVVTKTGDISLFLKDGDSAYLVEPGDDAAFAEKLRYVLSHPEEAKHVGEHGYMVAMKHFNYQIEADKVIEKMQK